MSDFQTAENLFTHLILIQINRLTNNRVIIGLSILKQVNCNNHDTEDEEVDGSKDQDPRRIDEFAMSSD